MSNKRSSDMASIDAAIQGGLVRKREDKLLRFDVADSLRAGGLSAKDEDVDAVISDIDKQDKANASALSAQEKANADALGLEKQQQSLIKQRLQQAGQSSLQAVGSVQNGIGSLAMPGGLGLPVAVLIVLLALLIPVNGKTRLGWLWAVITGNAELSDQATGGGPVDTSGATPNEGTATGGGPPPQIYVPPNFYPQEMDEW